MSLNPILKKIIITLYRKQMIKFGEYILSSGRKSPYYIDLRILPSYPQLHRRIIYELANMIRNSRVKYDVIIGIETSGIIHASYLGCLMKKPIAYVRKKIKDYGTKNIVEGIIENKHVVLIDDVSTTGNTLYNAIKVLRENKAIVEKAYVIIDRCEGAREKLLSLNIELKPLITIYDILEVLDKENLVEKHMLEKIMNYIDKYNK